MCFGAAPQLTPKAGIFKRLTASSPCKGRRQHATPSTHANPTARHDPWQGTTCVRRSHGEGVLCGGGKGYSGEGCAGGTRVGGYDGLGISLFAPAMTWLSVRKQFATLPPRPPAPALSHTVPLPCSGQQPPIPLHTTAASCACVRERGRRSGGRGGGSMRSRRAAHAHAGAGGVGRSGAGRGKHDTRQCRASRVPTASTFP